MPDPLPSLASTHSWREQLRDAVTDPDELLRALGLRRQDVDCGADAARQFALKAPHSFIRRMRRGDPADPLLRQVLASAQETLPQAGYVDDPVGETGAANPRPGLIHKYRGRVLLSASPPSPPGEREALRRVGARLRALGRSAAEAQRVVEGVAAELAGKTTSRAEGYWTRSASIWRTRSLW